MSHSKNLFKIVNLLVLLLCASAYAARLTQEDFQQIKEKIGSSELSARQTAELARLLKTPLFNQGPQPSLLTEEEEEAPTSGSSQLSEVKRRADKPVKGDAKKPIKRLRFASPQEQNEPSAPKMNIGGDEFLRSAVEDFPGDKENDASAANKNIFPRDKAAQVLMLSPLKSPSVGGKGEDIRLDAIYAWIAVEGEDRTYIPKHEERIDFSTLLGKRKITDRNLDSALAKIDERLREWLVANPELYYRTIYVGLSQDIAVRAAQHQYGLREIADVDIPQTESHAFISSKKVNFYDQVYRQGFGVYMCSFVYNIPQEYRKIVEVLVGAQLGVLHKGNTLLGNDAAWKRVASYIASKRRHNVVNKNSIVETYHNETVKCLLKSPISVY